MSNQLAIAAVTETLRRLIEAAVQADDGSAVVVARPPDKVNPATNRLNLFLYQAEVEPAFRNRTDVARPGAPGEIAEPPLPLCLYYLLMVYGTDQDTGDVGAHRLLGRAMLTLHDHPVLGASEIASALPGNDLHEQVERVRITPLSLSVEEMSRLWGSFATNYRLSTAYKASVILIDSTRARRAPLPVLTLRTADGRGLQVQPNLIPPFPALTGIALPANKASAELGDQVTLTGFHLDGATVRVQLSHASLAAPIVIPDTDFVAASPTSITVQLPAGGAARSQYAAGLYRAAVVVTDGADTRSTNALAFSLAPTVLSRSPANAAAGNVAVAVTCVPQIRAAQTVALLFGSRAVPAGPFVAPANPSDPSVLQFSVSAAQAGRHFLRLRVDGVDSNLVKLAGVPPVPQFDPDQSIVIT